jgi:hypothetical protein
MVAQLSKDPKINGSNLAYNVKKPTYLQKPQQPSLPRYVPYYRHSIKKILQP